VLFEGGVRLVNIHVVNYRITTNILKEYNYYSEKSRIIKYVIQTTEGRT
jgi:hypothetical protein